MPPKVRDLISDLEKSGFVSRGGKGSHRNFDHPHAGRITISGRLGDDAKPYQIREVRLKIQEAKR